MWRRLLFAAALAFLACALAPVADRKKAPFQARFTVRGRWPGERVIACRIDAQDGPLAPDAMRAAILGAMATWNATSMVTFRLAGEGETPDVVLAWRRGAHGDCVPFGSDGSVAHTGPVARGTFVHFDAERDWSASGLSLQEAALHELGHVLGLDHSPDETALMYPEPARERTALGLSDLAGLHALYGGGRAQRGDLVVRRPDGKIALVLPQVAPPENTNWAVFDADGDGSSELLVWRTDAAGAGALWEYEFERGPVLARTIGPAYGVSAPGAKLSCCVTQDGRRLIVLAASNGRVVRRFDAQGLLANTADLPPEAALPASSTRGDLDGDGVLETIERRE